MIPPYSLCAQKPGIKISHHMQTADVLCYVPMFSCSSLSCSGNLYSQTHKRGCVRADFSLECADEGTSRPKVLSTFSSFPALKRKYHHLLQTLLPFKNQEISTEDVE